VLSVGTPKMKLRRVRKGPLRDWFGPLAWRGATPCFFVSVAGIGVAGADSVCVAMKGVGGGQFRLISGETRRLAVSVAGKEVREGPKLERRSAKLGKGFNTEIAEGAEDTERSKGRAGERKLEKGK
jgi:hypothetical protein